MSESKTPSLEWQKKYKIISWKWQDGFLLVDLKTCLTMWDGVYATREDAEQAAIEKVFDKLFKKMLTN